jgi:hypothetical protein
MHFITTEVRDNLQSCLVDFYKWLEGLPVPDHVFSQTLL